MLTFIFRIRLRTMFELRLRFRIMFRLRLRIMFRHRIMFKLRILYTGFPTLRPLQALLLVFLAHRR